MEWYILLVYLICISAVGVIMTVYDKSAARHKKRRVPERTLLFLGFLGAALPMFITMQIIRHKTKHAKFMIGLPVEFLLHATLVILVLMSYLPMPL